MVFSSIVFLFYFLPIFLFCYFLADKKYKNAILLIGSVIFYSWGAPKFIAVILITTFVDFHIVAWMHRMENERSRRILLASSVFLNVGLLFYFKYSGFFVENINYFLSGLGIGKLAWPALLLPIGISFYTFETITYVVDVYRRVHKPLGKFWDYQMYILLFPKLIAGPIVRFHELADQISDRSVNENTENKITGFYRFVLGLAKKVLIANTLGGVADQIFSLNVAEMSSQTAWWGSLAYTFQIYFDFSGYSDMAIGLAKMFGFRFPENFNNPYVSRSINEFWRRWHITLGSWMKNYLYIPLGGNRVKSKGRMYLNLWLVFLASGFWHGASWSFIVWGAYHGLFIVLERGHYGKFLKKAGKLPALLITFFTVNIGWVFFRITDIREALGFIYKMFNFSTLHNRLPFIDSEFFFCLTIAVIFSFFTITSYTQKIQNIVYHSTYNSTKHVLVSSICLVLFILSVASITSAGFNPFIYFRF